MFAKTNAARTAEIAARAEQDRLIAAASRAAHVANLEMRRKAARRDSQRRFDEVGLPRGLYLEV